MIDLPFVGYGILKPAIRAIWNKNLIGMTLLVLLTGCTHPSTSVDQENATKSLQKKDSVSKIRGPDFSLLKEDQGSSAASSWVEFKSKLTFQEPDDELTFIPYQPHEPAPPPLNFYEPFDVETGTEIRDPDLGLTYTLMPNGRTVLSDMILNIDQSKQAMGIAVDSQDTQDGIGTTSLPLTSRTDTRKWPNAIVYYSLEGLAPHRIEMVKKAIYHYELYTPLRFRERITQDHYVQFKDDEEGCFADVGQQKRGRQVVNLGPPRERCEGCEECDLGSAIHEIGHAIGFLHEHQRSDRDFYIQVIFDKIYEDKKKNFKTYENLRGVEGEDIGDYDTFSIMHYPPCAFSSSNPSGTDCLPAEATILTRDGKMYEYNRYGLSYLDRWNISQVYCPLLTTNLDRCDKDKRYIGNRYQIAFFSDRDNPPPQDTTEMIALPGTTPPPEKPDQIYFTQAINSQAFPHGEALINPQAPERFPYTVPEGANGLHFLDNRRIVYLDPKIPEDFETGLNIALPLSPSQPQPYFVNWNPESDVLGVQTGIPDTFSFAQNREKDAYLFVRRNRGDPGKITLNTQEGGSPRRDTIHLTTSLNEGQPAGAIFYGPPGGEICSASFSMAGFSQFKQEDSFYNKLFVSDAAANEKYEVCGYADPPYCRNMPLCKIHLFDLFRFHVIGFRDLGGAPQEEWKRYNPSLSAERVRPFIDPVAYLYSAYNAKMQPQNGNLVAYFIQQTEPGSDGKYYLKPGKIWFCDLYYWAAPDGSPIMECFPRENSHALQKQLDKIDGWFHPDFCWTHDGKYLVVSVDPKQTAPDQITSHSDVWLVPAPYSNVYYNQTEEEPQLNTPINLTQIYGDDTLHRDHSPTCFPEPLILY